MDELRARPCEVDGRPALFHRWIEEDQAILSANALYRAYDADRMIQKFREDLFAPDGCSVEVVRQTFALVEYRDGTIAKVKPELIRFTGKEGQA